MLLSQLVRSCLRRWYLVVFGLLATAALTWFAYTSTSATYQIQATAVLLPGSTTVPEAGNGFLYLGGLTPALEVLLRSVNSDGTAQEVLGDAFDDDDAAASYEVTRDIDASGPIMRVVATGASQDEARSVLESVLEVIPVRLAELQSDVDVPEGSQMTVLQLSVDNRVEPLTTNRTRIVLGVAASGVVLTVIATGLIDGLILSVRRRREQTAPTQVRRRDRSASVPVSTTATSTAASTAASTETQPSI